VQQAVPVLADDISSPSKESDGTWSVEQAETAHFTRLVTNQSNHSSTRTTAEGRNSEFTGRSFSRRPSRIPWAESWMPVAACALAAVALTSPRFCTAVSERVYITTSSGKGANGGSQGAVGDRRAADCGANAAAHTGFTGPPRLP
jgi:hypothetical protein